MSNADLNQRHLIRAEPSTGVQLRALLDKLYADQLRVSHNEYLRYHASKQAISSRVNSFLAYQNALPATGRVLDWGCQHAVDACMVRAVLPDLALEGCDFLPEGSYPEFWRYSGLKFTPLSHHIQLPYEDGTFDCVIGGGVLEHTAMDYECLKELYRVIKPGGTLVLTHLPNKYSYTEFAAREFRKRDFHRRLYTVAGITAMLKHTGFYPERIQRHRFLPTNSLQAVTSILSPFEPLIDRLWPLNLFCGDLMAVARKVHTF